MHHLVEPKDDLVHRELVSATVHLRTVLALLWHLNLDQPIVEVTHAQQLAEGFAVVLDVGGAHQRVEELLLNLLLHLLLDFLHGARLGHGKPRVGQVPNNLVDVLSDEPHLRELGRLHLDKRCAGHLSQAARDLSLADASRSDHQDVLRHDVFPQRFSHVLPAPPIAHSDCDRALCLRLADDVPVELLDDFPRLHARGFLLFLVLLLNLWPGSLNDH
mmetsp:Transcript_71531/g.141837  ORF Transcript_71531/g.141837 Transcript_71531/m.141837 type:complete len:217 (+) Transcript_71531:1099-1749(+)